MAEVLTAAQLRRLTEHTYSSSGTSITEPWMQKFWRWLVEQVPLWWAPNAITLAGLVINITTTLVLIFYSPDARREVPGWSFVLAAVGLFVYQALDAIDGKQARRTKSNTPLGELFDHGCDAISTAFVTLGTCIALQLGHWPGVMFAVCFSCMFMFYTAHWQTYVSGTLKFGFFDVTEAQFSVMGIYVVSGLFGSGLWNTVVPVLGVELKMFPLAVIVLGMVYSGHNYFRIILMQGGSGKNGSTIAGTSVLSPVPPLAITYVLAVMIWQKSIAHTYENHPCLYILSFGFVIAKITHKLVIAHMTKSEMDVLDSSLIGPGMLFLNQYFNTLFNEYIILWMCCFYCSLDLLVFSKNVCTQICNFLEISCFSITVETGTTTSRHSATNGTESSRPVTRASSRLTHKK